MINGPHTPDLAHQVSEVGAEPGPRAGRTEISSALIGSCTNSSYEDITRAASIARGAGRQGLRAKTELLITPGSEQVRATIERDGLLADLEAIGGTVLANACGPCIGQWSRTDLGRRPGQHDRQHLQPQLPQAQRRQRQHPGVRDLPRRRSSPCALAGTLDFDPLTDTLTADDGERGPARAAGGRAAPGPGLRPRRVRASSPRRPTARGVEVDGRPRQRAPPAARAVRPVGRQGLRRACRCS